MIIPADTPEIETARDAYLATKGQPHAVRARAYEKYHDALEAARPPRDICLPPAFSPKCQPQPLAGGGDFRRADDRAVAEAKFQAWISKHQD